MDFMETPKIILRTDAMISKCTWIRCFKLLMLVEAGIRGLVVSTTVLGIKVLVIKSAKNLSIKCSVLASILARLVNTRFSRHEAADLAS